MRSEENVSVFASDKLPPQLATLQQRLTGCRFAGLSSLLSNQIATVKVEGVVS